MHPHTLVPRLLRRTGQYARSWVGGFVIALVLLGLGTATAATGGVFTLGKANSAGKVTALKNTGPGPALKLGTKSATAPNLAVSNTAKILRLNADLFDGLDSAALQRRVSGTCAAGEAATAVTVNGQLQCAALPTGPEVFFSSGTYVVPAGVTHLRVEVWGAGGTGHENLVGPNGGGGGGAGAYLKKLINVGPGQTCTVTVGIGGTWVTGNPNGGSTTVQCGAASATAPGGQGASLNTSIGGAGGNAGPYGVSGFPGESANSPLGGAGGRQVGGGDVGGAGGGGTGGNALFLSSGQGGPGLAIIHVS